MADFYTLQSHEALERWGEIEPLLMRIESADAPMSLVKEHIRTRAAQVWCIGTPIECVWLTKIEHTPSGTYGALWLGAGDLRIAEAIRTHSEPWFRRMGCKAVQIVGRRGWKKVFEDYEEKAVILVKTL